MTALASKRNALGISILLRLFSAIGNTTPASLQKLTRTSIRSTFLMVSETGNVISLKSSWPQSQPIVENADKDITPLYSAGETQFAESASRGLLCSPTSDNRCVPLLSSRVTFLQGCELICPHRPHSHRSNKPRCHCPQCDWSKSTGMTLNWPLFARWHCLRKVWYITKYSGGASLTLPRPSSSNVNALTIATTQCQTCRNSQHFRGIKHS